VVIGEKSGESGNTSDSRAIIAAAGHNSHCFRQTRFAQLPAARDPPADKRNHVFDAADKDFLGGKRRSVFFAIRLPRTLRYIDGQAAPTRLSQKSNSTVSNKVLYISNFKLGAL